MPLDESASGETPSAEIPSIAWGRPYIYNVAPIPPSPTIVVIATPASGPYVLIPKWLVPVCKFLHIQVHEGKDDSTD